MSAQLVMAGRGKSVVHDATHDLESFFYVLVGICVLYEGPFKQKSEEDLAECYDVFFNTFEPSILKTITIQSDLTWTPLIVKHIHPYFKSLIPLLTKLRSEIILPLATDEHTGEFYRKSPCNHDTFIKHIIDTLSELQPDDWTDMSLKGKSDGAARKDVIAMRLESGPPAATLLLVPPKVPKNILPGRGTIRSDSGLHQPTERSLRRARECDDDIFLPSSPSKRPRLELGEPSSLSRHASSRMTRSTSALPTRRSMGQRRGKTFGQ